MPRGQGQSPGCHLLVLGNNVQVEVGGKGAAVAMRCEVDVIITCGTGGGVRHHQHLVATLQLSNGLGTCKVTNSKSNSQQLVITVTVTHSHSLLMEHGTSHQHNNDHMHV